MGHERKRHPPLTDGESQASHHQDRDLGEVVDLPLSCTNDLRNRLVLVTGAFEQPAVFVEELRAAFRALPRGG